MPVLIKSNGIATNTLGNLKTIGSTAIAEYNAYKARVLADGGVIKDEERTKAAFSLLFDNGYYGNLAYFIAAWAGVKLDASGGVLKAYSIDGADLVGKVVGAGELPKITASHFTFATNSSTVNSKGGYLELSSSPYLAKNNEYAFFGQITSASAPATAANAIMSARAVDGDPSGATLSPLYDIREGGTYDVYFQASILNYNSNYAYTTLRILRSTNKTFIVHVKAGEESPRNVIYMNNSLGQVKTERTQERFLHTKTAFTVGASVFQTGINFSAVPITMAGAFTNISEQAARRFSSLVF